MIKRVCLAVCLLLLCLTAAASAAESLPAETISASAEGELFQAGSFTGAYTRPGEVGLMSGVEEELYRMILTGLENEEAEIDISGLGIRVDTADGGIDKNDPDYQMASSTYFRVINDHPALYYVKGEVSFRAGRSPGEREYTLTYVTPFYDESDTPEKRAAFQDKLDQALGLAEPWMGELDMALLFHDYLVTAAAYPSPVPPSPAPCYSAYGALVEGDAVCQGYALAYKLLLNEAGIECITISSDELNHMWNAVELDGHWYYVDATWDDPVPDQEGRCRHTYFLLSEETIRDEAHGHDAGDWTGPAGTDGRYESGWAFNGCDTALRHEDGAYYYIRNDYVDTNTVAGSALYYGALDGPDGAEILCTFRSEGIFSAVWLEDQVYCLGEFGGAVTRVDLRGGAAAPVGQLPEAQAYGLRPGPSGDAIEVVRKGTREAVYAIAIRDYPAAWDNADTGVTAVAGTGWAHGSLQLGLMWAEDARDALLLGAFYGADGRLLAVRQIAAEELTPGLHVLTLEAGELPAGYDRAVFFLLDGGRRLCPLAPKTPVERAR